MISIKSSNWILFIRFTPNLFFTKFSEMRHSWLWLANVYIYETIRNFSLSHICVLCLLASFSWFFYSSRFIYMVSLNESNKIKLNLSTQCIVWHINKCIKYQTDVFWCLPQDTNSCIFIRKFGCCYKMKWEKKKNNIHNNNNNNNDKNKQIYVL